MKISLSAILNFGSKGTEKLVQQTKAIRDNISAAVKGTEDLNTGAGKASGGFDSRTHRRYRGAANNRGAGGRDFAGLAHGMKGGEDGGDTSQFVASYAVLAANLFAVTAAFGALQRAAQTEQLTRGLELVGSRGGAALKITARGLREVTDNAISTADSMKVVAQATAAGFNGEEIARLGAVARGASVALGRDMADALDRLTRGTIKLEPELLDELGIMTRLDEAVKEYAKSNNKTVSSLTQTERRQAFLNAVLAEGERKFGDISKQIDSNPYDQLSSSMRDLGTSGLNLLNGFLSPVAKIISDMPALAVIPLMVVLKDAASKVLPSMGNALQKLGDKANSAGSKLTFFQAQMSDPQELIDQAKTKSMKLFEDNNLGGSGRLSKETLEGAFNLNNYELIEDAKEQIVAIDREIVALAKEDAQANQVKILALQQINSQLKQTVKDTRVIESLNKKSREASFEQTLASKASARIKQAGEGFGRGELFKPVLQSFGSIFTEITDKEQSFSKRIRSSASAMVGFGRVASMAFTRLIPLLGWAITAFQLLVGFFNSGKTEADKLFEKAKKDLKEVSEGAKKTAEQIKMMLKAGSGQRGEALDAASESLKALNAQLEITLELQGKVSGFWGTLGNATENVGRSVLKIGADFGKQSASWGLPWARAVSMALMEPLDNAAAKSEDVSQRINRIFTDKSQREAFLAQKAILEQVDPTGWIEIEKQLLKVNANLEDVVNTTKNVVQANILVSASYKDLGALTTQFGKNLQDLVPKDLETPFTKIATDVKEINKMVKAGLEDEAAVGQQVAKIGVERLRILSNINELYNENSQSLYGISNDVERLNELLAKKTAIEKLTGDAYERQKGDLEEINRLIAEQEKLVGSVFTKLLSLLLEDTLNTESIAVDLAIMKHVASEQTKINNLLIEEQKIRFDIRKINREGLLEAAKQGQSINLDNRIASQFELINREESLTLLRKENAYKKETLEAERRIALAEQENAKAALIAGEDKSKEIAFYQSKINMIDQQAQVQDRVFTAQERAAQQAIVNQQRLVESLNTELAQRGRRNELIKKELEQEKELLGIKSSIRLMEVEARGEAIKREAFNNRTTVDPQAQRTLEIDRIKVERQNAEEEFKLALKEHDLKLELLAFEFDASKALLEAAQGLLIAAGKPQEAAQVTSIIEEMRRPSEALRTHTADLQEQLSKQWKIKDQSLAAEQEFLESLTSLGLAIANIEIASNGLKSKISSFANGGWMPFGAGQAFSSGVEQAGGWDRVKGDEEQLRKLKQASIETASLQIVVDGLNRTFDTLTNGIGEAFAGIIDGTKTAKQAFGNLAVAVLKSIAQMIVQMLVLRTVSMFLGGPTAGITSIGMSGANAMLPQVPGLIGGGAAAGGILPMATGGIMSRSMAPQGVIKQPTYLVGEGKHNEAVVPLPNGRSIPVQMHGGNSSSNNVQVNVNISNEGNVQTETQGQDANDIGTLIANAVQKELQMQKMPGGILNRYGAS